jgi:hypothetical protein
LDGLRRSPSAAQLWQDWLARRNRTSSWRNAKHIAQWGATLQAYAMPVFGKLRSGENPESGAPRVTKIEKHAAPEGVDHFFASYVGDGDGHLCHWPPALVRVR